MAPYSEEEVLGIKESPRDGFGVIHYDVFYSEGTDRMWLVHDAPDEGALKKRLASTGYQAEWFEEVKSARTRANP